MQFRSIKISELPEFVNSDLFRSSSIIPITSFRALSHYKNPRAEEDDISLIVCISDTNNIVGYIGIIPDKLYNGQKAGWLSCWWTNNNEGKKIGLHLFLMAIKSWNSKFIITDFTPQIKNIITKTRLFTFTKTTKGLKGFLRLNTAVILPKKYNSLKNFRPILSIVDKVANVFINVRLLNYNRKFKASLLHSERLDFIDNETSEFIRKHNTNEYIKRGAAELNWILNYPWVLQKDKCNADCNEEAKKYYFSSVSDKFIYHSIKLLRDNEMIAFVIFRQRDQEFTIPYIYFSHNDIKDIVKFLYSYLIDHKANTISIFNKVLTEHINSNPGPFFYIRENEKDFAVSNDLKAVLDEERILQDGDGDYVFT